MVSTTHNSERDAKWLDTTYFQLNLNTQIAVKKFDWYSHRLIKSNMTQMVLFIFVGKQNRFQQLVTYLGEVTTSGQDNNLLRHGHNIDLLVDSHSQSLYKRLAILKNVVCQAEARISCVLKVDTNICFLMPHKQQIIVLEHFVQPTNRLYDKAISGIHRCI